MPRGTPRIGSPRTVSSAEEELLNAPEAESLGTVRTIRTPTGQLRVGDDGTLIDEGERVTRPPWEAVGHRDNTDARTFVKVPDNWVLRWINPRMIDHIGWRDWQPVMASDPRVTVLVRELVSPENNIRRGRNGDILGWMYRSWYESRQKQKAAKVARTTGEARDRAEAVREQISRGPASRYVKVDSVQHPTNTTLDGASVRD